MGGTSPGALLHAIHRSPETALSRDLVIQDCVWAGGAEELLWAAGGLECLEGADQQTTRALTEPTCTNGSACYVTLKNVARRAQTTAF